MNMKILLAHPGKLKTVPMGQFAGDALRALGHEVVDVDLSSQWHDKLRERLTNRTPHQYANQRLLRVADAVRPDLMLAIFGFDLTPESLEYLKAHGITRACWWLNDPFQFDRSLAKAHHYDFLFSNALGSVEDYHRAGIRHAHWLPTACNPGIHRRMDAVPKYRCEVCFAGDWSPLRQAWCEKLASHFDLRIFGPWKKKLPKNSPLWNHLQEGFFTPNEMASMFASADVVFNLHSWYGRWDHGTNPRLFEAAGCGAYQVVDWKREIPELFDCGTEISCYRNTDDLITLVKKILADPVLRRQSALAAQRRAYGEHTYQHRMQSLLSVVTGTVVPTIIVVPDLQTIFTR